MASARRGDRSRSGRARTCSDGLRAVVRARPGRRPGTGRGRRARRASKNGSRSPSGATSTSRTAFARSRTAAASASRMSRCSRAGARSDPAHRPSSNRAARPGRSESAISEVEFASSGDSRRRERRARSRSATASPGSPSAMTTSSTSTSRSGVTSGSRHSAALRRQPRGRETSCAPGATRSGSAETSRSRGHARCCVRSTCLPSSSSSFAPSTREALSRRPRACASRTVEGSGRSSPRSRRTPRSMRRIRSESTS